MKCRIYVLALLAATFSSIQAMEAPEEATKVSSQEKAKQEADVRAAKRAARLAELRNAEREESTPAVAVTRQPSLYDQWLAKAPTLIDGTLKPDNSYTMDNDGFFYEVKGRENYLMVWRPLPESYIEQAFNALKSAPTYFRLLPIEVFKMAFCKEFDPATYRCTGRLALDGDLRIDSQGNIYHVRSGIHGKINAQIEIYKKNKQALPCTHERIATIELDSYSAQARWPIRDSYKLHSCLALIEEENLLFALEVGKIGVWKMSEPTDPKSYKRIGSFTDKALTAEPGAAADSIVVSPSGLLFSMNSAGKRFCVWQRSNPGDPLSYKCVFILNGEGPIGVGPDDLLWCAKSGTRKIWKMALPTDAGTYCLVGDKTFDHNDYYELIETPETRAWEAQKKEFERTLRELYLPGPEFLRTNARVSVMAAIYNAAFRAKAEQEAPGRRALAEARTDLAHKLVGHATKCEAKSLTERAAGKEENADKLILAAARYFTKAEARTREANAALAPYSKEEYDLANGPVLESASVARARAINPLGAWWV